MSGPIVNVQCGKLLGVIEKDEDGNEYFAFKGVPFAETPVGELRFKESIPKKPWTGIKDAVKHGPICAQYDVFSKKTTYDEDCLHLNVYTRTIDNPDAHKAVFVWIHGGGFMFGCGNDLYNGPEYLLRKDIVLVVIQYRLGVFGFLDLEDEIAPGNFGLKDQVLALRWVKDNIRTFGGDPSNVTIAGESAGSGSVHYLTLSPLAKGLFHKAIFQSGVALNPWSYIINPKQNAIQFCETLGKRLEDPKQIVDFLKTLDTKVLQEGQEKMIRATGAFPFGPGVDSKSLKPLMPIPVEDAAKNGVHVPCLIGYNSREGIFFLNAITNVDFFKMIDENFGIFFRFRMAEILKRHNLSLEQFRRLYYKRERITVENKDIFADIMGDLFFVEGTHKFIRMQSELSSAPTYMFIFAYDPPESIKNTLIPNPPPGVGHHEEVGYVFKMRFFDQIGVEHPKKGSQRFKVMDQMTEMWSNFAKYGRPTIETSDLIPVYWQPISDGTVIRYLNIDEDLTMQSMLNIDQKYLSASKMKI